MAHYIIAPISSYNEWDELWETKIGDTDLKQLYIACGETEVESRMNATLLIADLERYRHNSKIGS